MQLASEQRDDNERSIIVQTAFFKQQAIIRQDQQAQDQLAWVVAHNEQIKLQQQYFQFQYEKLQKICQVIKNNTQEMQAKIPVLDQQLWEPRIKSLNLLTSATDNFLKEVVKYGLAHRDDITILKKLATDLEVTSNLLSSPTTQNMEAFQNRLSSEPRYKNDTKVYDTMIKIGVAITFLTIPVMLGAFGAFLFLGLPAAAAIAIITGAELTVISAATFTLAVDLMKGVSANKDHPITAHQKTIAAETSQYLPPAPSFG